MSMVGENAFYFKIDYIFKKSDSKDEATAIIFL